MIALLKGLVVLSLSKGVFEWMNLTTMGEGSTSEIVIRATKLLPLQLASYIGFTTGLKMSYSAIGDKIWLLLIIEEAVNYVVKISLRNAIFKQPITPGIVAGLALSLLAAVIAGVWK